MRITNEPSVFANSELSAKAKLTEETAAARGWEKVDQDHMPAEVATDLLCDPVSRRSNRERKVFARARMTIWQSKEKPLPMQSKLAKRVMDWTWMQLNITMRRLNAKRAQVQRRYVAALAAVSKLDPVPPQLDAMINLFNVQAATMDAMLDVIENRIGFIKGLTQGKLPAGAVELQDPASRRILSWVIDTDPESPHEGMWVTA